MDDPNWKRMMFKGNKVWLAMDEKNHPVVRNNKVLIKYQQNQDYEYWVQKQSVVPIDSNLLKKKSRSKKPSPPPGPGEHAKALRDRPPAEAILVYTDGASSSNPGPSGIGAVLRLGSKKKEISQYIGIATNNIAELKAIKVALQTIRARHLPVRLYTDSAYCHGLLSRGWKPKRNEKLVASIKTLMEKFKDLKILKVEGHAGIRDNETADRLARQAITRTKPSDSRE